MSQSDYEAEAHDWLNSYSYPDHLNPNMVKLLARALRDCAERARREELAACAQLCQEIVWMRDIDWWREATKREVAAESAYQCAAAIRARARAERPADAQEES